MPVTGSIRGGKNVSDEWGILKVKVLTCWPMLSNALRRAWREKQLVLKLTLMSANRYGATGPAVSRHARRNARRSSCVANERKHSRVRSVRQNLTKAAEGMIVMLHYSACCSRLDMTLWA